MIRKATTADIPTIQSIATKSWQEAYASILSSEQMNFMLDMFYNDKVLTEKINAQAPNGFYLFDNKGFIHVEKKTNEILRLEKIYLLPETHHQGIGKELVTFSEKMGKEQDFSILQLNVNRHNQSAIQFYKKRGFEIVKEEDNAIGHDYFMNDYVMELKIK